MSAGPYFPCKAVYIEIVAPISQQRKLEVLKDFRGIQISGRYWNFLKQLTLIGIHQQVSKHLCILYITLKKITKCWKISFHHQYATLQRN